MKKLFAMNKLDEKGLIDLVIESELVKLPGTIRVMETREGEFVNSDKEVIKYASMMVADLEELEALTSIGLEDNVNLIRLKISGYKGESLSQFEGKNFDSNNFDIQFHKTNKGIQSLMFSAELTGLREVK